MLTRAFIPAAVAALLMAAMPASAACYADYKAKRDKPLRLHYGVIEVDADPCTMSKDVRDMVESRIAKDGWKLLQVQSVFDDSGLESKKKDAGQFFLRY